jgi:hypothetical protein
MNLQSLQPTLDPSQIRAASEIAVTTDSAKRTLRERVKM